MQPARDLMEKVGRNEVVVGVLATDHVWTDLVEICLRAGLDYLIVDMEHGPHDTQLVGEVWRTHRLALVQRSGSKNSHAATSAMTTMTLRLRHDAAIGFPRL